MWNLPGHMPRGDHHQPINVVPWFHKWGGSPWQIRVFFDCASYRGRGPV